MTVTPMVQAPMALPSILTPSDASLSQTHATGLKLTCKQPDLARGLSIVSRAVLAHSTRPILANILLATEGGRLRLSATTLEIGIQVWIDAQIEREGITAVPADVLTKMVSLLPHETVVCSVAHGSQTLCLQCAGSISHLRGQDPREFPVIPGGESELQAPSCEIEAGLLKSMIEHVAFAADTNDSKPALTAVFTQIAGGTLTFAAANTFRLTERIAPLPGGGESQVLIPARNLMELSRILPSQGGVRVIVTPQQNQVVFHCEEGERIDFVSRLIAGAYPAYQRSIPREFTTRAVVETRQFVAAVGQASVFARDDLKTVRVTLKPGEQSRPTGTLTVEADDATMGDHTATVAATVSGPQRSLIFPVKYLAEALFHMETPQVVFSVLDPGKPAVLKPMGDIQYISMLMSAQEKKALQA